MQQSQGKALLAPPTCNTNAKAVCQYFLARLPSSSALRFFGAGKAFVVCAIESILNRSLRKNGRLLPEASVSSKQCFWNALTCPCIWSMGFEKQQIFLQKNSLKGTIAVRDGLNKFRKFLGFLEVMGFGPFGDNEKKRACVWRKMNTKYDFWKSELILRKRADDSKEMKQQRCTFPILSLYKMFVGHRHESENSISLFHHGKKWYRRWMNLL
ncbi:Hypothetical predicted protein [Podarcis lilfordi]|uniref:Uncharacterized protein n=1 Tax=Podarcis lilfordi TaxID=74358 RepID=A0AA35PJD5_9SAUR|nr:Hypothetical predicted protein [Podarcis lilfordi]